MNKYKTFFQGFAIGAGMSIPGLSGGTLAIMLGIYNKLIYSVANLLSDIKNTLFFLSVFACGGILGFFTAAKLVTLILSTSAEVPLRYAFFGAAAAAMIPVLKKANAMPIKLTKLLLIVAGIAAASLISLIPQISLDTNSTYGLLMQLLGGFILAAALILPGISGSQMLMTLGLYEQVMKSVSSLALLKLLPLTVGCAVGGLLIAKIMSKLLENTESAYLVIIGFMFFSMKDLIPRSSNYTELLIGIICAIIGFVVVSLCLSKEIHKSESTIL